MGLDASAPNYGASGRHQTGIFLRSKPSRDCDEPIIAAIVWPLSEARQEVIVFSISKRSEVEPFHAMDVLAEATKRRAGGHPVISMAVGQPSHPAPQAALEAARAALAEGRIGYTDALGTARLKHALAWHYRNRHGLEIDPSRIAITTGSSAAFNLAFLTLFDAGDAVAIARPGYPACGPAADVWLADLAKNPYFAADPSPAHKAAAGLIWEGWNIVTYPDQPVWSNSVITKLVEGKDLSSLMKSFGDDLAQAAEAAGYSVVKS
jgi:hypothetical protein